MKQSEKGKRYIVIDIGNNETIKNSTYITQKDAVIVNKGKRTHNI